MAISNLDWNGTGKALDIGRGNGALAIKAAKKFPLAQIIGIDF
jgi:methylase of polypeptide subunit release factors